MYPGMVSFVAPIENDKGPDSAQRMDMKENSETMLLMKPNVTGRERSS